MKDMTKVKLDKKNNLFVCGPNDIANLLRPLTEAHIAHKRYNWQMICEGRAPMSRDEAVAGLKRFEDLGIRFVVPNIIESRVPDADMMALAMEVYDPDKINASYASYERNIAK